MANLYLELEVKRSGVTYDVIHLPLYAYRCIMLYGERRWI